MRKLFVLGGLAFLLGTVGAIAQTKSSEASKSAAQEATGAKPKVTIEPHKGPFVANVFFRNKEGDRFLDPVCGKAGVVGEKTPFVEHGKVELVGQKAPSVEQVGKKYYFDSDDCAAKFKKDAPSYIAKFVLPGRVVAVSGDKIMVSDPVTGQRVEAGSGMPHRDHMGRRFFFGSDSTAKAFEADPMKYLGMHSTAAKKTEMGMPGDKKSVKTGEKTEKPKAGEKTDKKDAERKNEKEKK